MEEIELIEVSAEDVPRSRRGNPFTKGVVATAEILEKNPGKWFVIGYGNYADRPRLNNATSLLVNGRYKSLEKLGTYDRGRFETIVSGAKDAVHRNEHEVEVFARFIPKES